MRTLFVFLIGSFGLFDLGAYAQQPPQPRANPGAVGFSDPVAEAKRLGLAPKATENLQNEFTLEGFFAGQTIGKGTIFSKLIGASRSFNIRTVGTWDGAVLTLVENYQYAAGDLEQRVWKFTKKSAARYMGESEEIEDRIFIEIEGMEANFKYKKRLPRRGKDPVEITFDEVWTLKSNGVLESKTRLSKILRVGREAINFVRVGNETALKAPSF